uniref:ADP/ATP translocase n=1 Tax=Calidris pygmaea TaxID=425635 RepID=A0A8C3KLT0_9CHAR
FQVRCLKRKKEKQLFPTMNGLLTGGMVAAIFKRAVEPLERVKLLLRAPELGRDPGFWHGNLANIIRYFPVQALNFASKDKCKDFHVQKWNIKFFISNLFHVEIAGKSALFVSFHGLGDCIIQIGFVVSVQGIIVYRASSFGCYDTIKGLFPNPKQTPFILCFFVAQIVTTFSGMLSYPSHNVRRGMMMQRRETECQYRGTVGCFMKMYEQEGLNAFFHGAFSNIRRGRRGDLVLVLYGKIKDIFDLNVSESSGCD